MSGNNGNRSSTPHKGGSMLAGILLGMVLGLLIASGVAWYLMERPNPYVSHDQRPELSGTQPAPAGEPQAAPAGPATAANANTPAAGDNGKPRFEFYKVLTDNKQDGSLPVQQPATQSPAKAAASQSYVLQAGSFSNEVDADKLKARLALLGMEASVQTVTVPDKGIWHRVRLGPYRNADEMNKARAILKQNGVNATPTHN